WVGPAKTVARGAPFHDTVASLVKSAPLTSSVNEALPASSIDGFSPVIVAGGSGRTENEAAFDIALPVFTSTATDSADAMSAVRILAVSWPGLTKFVASGVPFQKTTEFGVKPEPTTEMVNAALPSNTVDGFRPVMEGGATMVKTTSFDDMAPVLTETV